MLRIVQLNNSNLNLIQILPPIQVNINCSHRVIKKLLFSFLAAYAASLSALIRFESSLSSSEPNKSTSSSSAGAFLTAAAAP
jgi:hypothetical protein